jgi:hypothetical protein
MPSSAWAVSDKRLTSVRSIFFISIEFIKSSFSIGDIQLPSSQEEGSWGRSFDEGGDSSTRRYAIF